MKLHKEIDSYRQSVLTSIIAAYVLVSVQTSFGIMAPNLPEMTNFDVRLSPANVRTTLAEGQTRPVTALQSRAPNAKVVFNRILGSPEVVRSSQGFSTPPRSGPPIPPLAQTNALAVALPPGPPDNYQAAKQFLNDNRDLFRHGERC